MLSREQIQARYNSDLEAAESFRDVNPERYAELRGQASDRRADSLDTLSQQAEERERGTRLASSRSAALLAFPKADPGAVVGNTEEEIQASAKRSHDHSVKIQEDALAAERQGRRPETRRQWTGSENGRQPAMPGGEHQQPTDRVTAAVGAAYDRTANIIEEARKPGTLRTYAPDTKATVFGSQDPEAQALADHRLLTPNTGLSDEAMKAKAEGRPFVSGGPGGPGDEDSRG